MHPKLTSCCKKSKIQNQENPWLSLIFQNAIVQVFGKTLSSSGHPHSRKNLVRLGDLWKTSGSGEENPVFLDETKRACLV